MRFTKLLSIVGFVIAASIAATAQAQSTKVVNCNWGWIGGSSFPGGWVSVEGCFVNGLNNGPVAQRTKRSTGECSIAATAPGVVISGTCLQPIVRVPIVISQGQCGSVGNYDEACWSRARAACPSQYGAFSTYQSGQWTCVLR